MGQHLPGIRVLGRAIGARRAEACRYGAVRACRHGCARACAVAVVVCEHGEADEHGRIAVATVVARGLAHKAGRKLRARAQRAALGRGVPVGVGVAVGIGEELPARSVGRRTGAGCGNDALGQFAAGAERLGRARAEAVAVLIEIAGLLQPAASVVACDVTETVSMLPASRLLRVKVCGIRNMPCSSMSAARRYPTEIMNRLNGRLENARGPGWHRLCSMHRPRKRRDIPQLDAWQARDPDRFDGQNEPINGVQGIC